MGNCFAGVKKARSVPKYKVVVCGGAGGIGQPLAMLMALDDRVKEVCVQDVTMAMVPAAGVAADLGHLERPAKVSSFAIDPAKKPVDQLRDCLTGAHLVLVPAGLPRKPGMTRDDLFDKNASIAKGLVEACAEYCPTAVIGLIVNPVNSIVPAMCEFYKKKGLLPRRIVGITTLDVVRANKFVAERTGTHVADVDVPVIGGHAGITILPLFSQVPPMGKIGAEEIKAMDVRTQDAGTEVVQAKDGKGSATLSMAYAGARLGKAVLSGLEGDSANAVECAYVAVLEDGKKIGTTLPYFTTKVKFGRDGVVEDVRPIGKLNDYEKGRLAEVEKQLGEEAQKGIEYAQRL
mmetsp:Transcript_28016/g.67291  ORF Transcript_28016/g.67291 Transcript_28016/m.67291 type:complete len:347 (+) Transcript_28016:55-1095(+)